VQRRCLDHFSQLAQARAPGICAQSQYLIVKCPWWKSILAAEQCASALAQRLSNDVGATHARDYGNKPDIGFFLAQPRLKPSSRSAQKLPHRLHTCRETPNWTSVSVAVGDESQTQVLLLKMSYRRVRTAGQLGVRPHSQRQTSVFLLERPLSGKSRTHFNHSLVARLQATGPTATQSTTTSCFRCITRGASLRSRP